MIRTLEHYLLHESHLGRYSTSCLYDNQLGISSIEEGLEAAKLANSPAPSSSFPDASTSGKMLLPLFLPSLFFTESQQEVREKIATCLQVDRRQRTGSLFDLHLTFWLKFNVEFSL